uniref:Uncharacterized protein n=1 Tax=Arundo donax TaxID=35708 RepID=A0A0A9B8U1_ARUDO
MPGSLVVEKDLPSISPTSRMPLLGTRTNTGWRAAYSATVRTGSGHGFPWRFTSLLQAMCRDKS